MNESRKKKGVNIRIWSGPKQQEFLLCLGEEQEAHRTKQINGLVTITAGVWHDRPGNTIKTAG